MNYFGSICISDIPKKHITKAENGKLYLNISVVERREIGKFGDTHFIKASVKKEDQEEGVNYIFGNLRPSEEHTPKPATEEEMPDWLRDVPDLSE